MSVQTKNLKSNKIRGIKGLAEFLNVSISTAHKFKASGEIPYYQIGKIVFFDSEEVLKSLKKGGELC